MTAWTPLLFGVILVLFLIALALTVLGALLGVFIRGVFRGIRW